MQFIVTGLDGKDEKALERRMAAREDHLAMAGEMKEKGNWLYAAAILDDNKNMAGSVIICEFESREILEKEWLDREPYVLGNVWKEIQVAEAAVPPLFLKQPDTGGGYR